MLMIGITLVSATVVENKVKLKDEKTSFFEIEDGEIITTIPIESYEIKSTEQVDEISVKNFGRLLIPGKPNLPSKIFSIAIPPGSELADVGFEVSDSIILTGNFEVPPASLPRVICEENPEIYQHELNQYNKNYNEVYGSDDPYPSSVVEFVRTAGYRRYNLVDVRVNPFTYYPLSNQLMYYPEISIHVSYTFPEGFSYDEIMVDNIPRAEQLAEKIIYNYDQARNWYQSGSTGRETHDYVIITLDLLTSKVTPLVDWEESKGRNVYVATTDWIDSNYDGWDLAEKMRNFLRDKYPSEKWGILDVCLIGDYDDVPMRLTALNVGYGRPETDYYYAELSLPDNQSWDKDGDHQYGENTDHIDFYAEVNVGRIPWSDANTVKHICEKSAAYEQTNDSAFKKNILLLGAFFWADTDSAVLMERKTAPTEHPWMEDWTMTRMYEEAQSSYLCDYDLSYANVKNVWSAGSYAFVNWAGHGSPTACYEYYPSQAFVDTQTCNYLNDDYPAIIFADACSNSDTDYNNLGRVMMKQGAIGFLGSTEVSYVLNGWNDPYDGSSQSLDYFFTICCTSGIFTQGQAHQWALLEMYTNNLWFYSRFEMFEWGSLWGNPDLTMGTVSFPPETPTKPDGPETWTLDSDAIFKSTTTDPEGHSIYYLFNWGDGTDSGWVGPYASGQTGQASHIWTELGEYEIKVLARDERYAQSDWSELHTITIVENEPPEKPTISGPTSGKPSKSLKFTFNSTDPEGYDLYYMVNWGDGHYQDYTGPYASGKEVTFSHSWSEAEDYNIIVKVRDQYGARSPQNNFRLKIKTFKERAVTSPVLIRFLENVMNRFPLSLTETMNDEAKQNLSRISSIGDWFEQTKLTALDSAAADWFGCSISIDGDYAIVGACYNDSEKGSAYIFKRNGTTWVQEAKLIASGGSELDRFGCSVSIDGNYAIVGAYAKNNYAGAVYVFARYGNTWSERSRLTASDGSSGDYFGYSVSLYDNYAIIGAFGDKSKSGSAYIFNRYCCGWNQDAKLTASDNSSGDYFGYSVSLYEKYAIVGAVHSDDMGTDSGSAYIFNGTGEKWVEEKKLNASDGESGDEFGVSVCINENSAIVGAYGDDGHTGSAYIFNRNDTTWVEEQKLNASDGESGDEFGVSVSMKSNYVIVGAQGDDDMGNDSGSAHIFNRTGATWSQDAKLTASDGGQHDAFGHTVTIYGDYAIIGAYLDDDLGNDSGSAYIFRGHNQAPNVPMITGHATGKTGIEYEYLFEATDPEDDEIAEYIINWGDNNQENITGPFASGSLVNASHTWHKKGNFTIKVKAKDIIGAESGWAELKVIMPRNRGINKPFLNVQNYPRLIPILRHLLWLWVSPN